MKIFFFPLFVLTSSHVLRATHASLLKGGAPPTEQVLSPKEVLKAYVNHLAPKEVKPKLPAEMVRLIGYYVCSNTFNEDGFSLQVGDKINVYTLSKYDRSGYDYLGYDKEGYTKHGVNKSGDSKYMYRT